MTITTWFTAVVEDVSDPTNGGRVRVRCLGFHTDDKSELPTEDLPWATCLLPVTSASTSGVGTSATGLVPGSWVFGFFRDGTEMQDPVILSSLASSSDADGYDNGVATFSGVGFKDPYGSYGVGGGNDIPSGVVTGSQTGGIGNYGEFASGGGVTLPSMENPPVPINVAGGFREKIIAVAKSRIGNTYETTANQGPGIAELWKATTYPGGYNAAAPWCSAFVCWCVKNTGVFDDSNRPKDASVSNFEAWARKSKSVVSVIGNPRTINAGDIITFKTSSHIGIASSSSDSSGSFISIDGNTFAPPGTNKPAGVHEKKRNVNIIKNVISVNV
jgi:hypothetical protein